jgi:hypothetical protein
MVLHDHYQEALSGRIYQRRRDQENLGNFGLSLILIKLNKEELIAQVEQELITNGVDEPVLLGIVHKFMVDCPDLQETFQIAGGINSQENQFVIFEIDPIQYVVMLDYPHIRSFVGNTDTYRSEVLDYTPNISVTIRENNISSLFEHFSRVPVLFATIRHRFGNDRVSEEVFDEVSKELGIDNL